jgi:hypothetical protein
MRSKNAMTAIAIAEDRVYDSGEIVDPGYYVDLDTGAVVQVREVDELPAGSRMVQYRRKFRRVPAERVAVTRRSRE